MMPPLTGHQKINGRPVDMWKNVPPKRITGHCVQRFMLYVFELCLMIHIMFGKSHNLRPGGGDNHFPVVKKWPPVGGKKSRSPCRRPVFLHAPSPSLIFQVEK